MRVVGTFAEVRHNGRGPVGLVPTMGYLHEGHLSHVHAARQAGDGTVVMSLFVNPLQFGPDEDLARYPRDLDRDRTLAEDAGVDVLFAPELEEMYPTRPNTRVEVGGPATALEARSRPGHFAGMATVVTKLFAGIRPDRAYFGRKDAQQLAVIRRLTADLSFPVEIVGGPIIRHADGLALSSRNVCLSAGDRIAAAGLCRGLMAAADAAEAGERHGPALEALVRAALMAKPGVHVDYVELASADRVERLVELDRPAFLAVAARVGAVRLIDNIHLDPVGNTADGKFVADRGVRLDRASVMDAGGR
ncbi:MAG: pantoate--beta-alanine ligase [Acidimicrobiia bacterium]|nr:pantoate--beta-alanine ligase [Acidimicrobiia bacterium]